VGFLKRSIWVLALASGGACLPEFDSDVAIVSSERVLAVGTSPAEVPPGGAVQLTALYARADGTLEEGALQWSFCTARRPLAELGPVNRACVDGESTALEPIGTGIRVETSLPNDACRLFGPDPPPAQPGEPAGRAVDPDPTGGYFQPIRVLEPFGVTMAGLRMQCGVAGATQQQALEYRRRYIVNQAPAPATLLWSLDDGATFAEGPATVPLNATVTLRVAWPDCPTAPVCGDGLCTLDESEETCPGECLGARGCGGAETYLLFDPVSQSLTTRREGMSAAWYRTGGILDEERTGRASDDAAPFSDNGWTAPEAPGSVLVWAVVRDDRGAAGWAALSVTVL